LIAASQAAELSGKVTQAADQKTGAKVTHDGANVDAFSAGALLWLDGVDVSLQALLEQLRIGTQAHGDVLQSNSA